MLKNVDTIATVLLIIGGLNWGLVGLFDYNLVTALFSGTMMTTITYSLVALSAIYKIFSVTGIQSRWGSTSS